MKSTVLFLLAAILLPGFAIAQNIDINNPLGLSNAEIKKLPTFNVEVDGKKFPGGHFLELKDDKVIMFSNVAPRYYKSPVFSQEIIPLDRIQKFNITDRNKKLRNSILGGIIAGALSYAIVDTQMQRTNPGRQSYAKETLNSLGTQKSPFIVRKFPAIAAGVTGFGVGIIIGENLAIKRGNAQKDRKKAYWTLRSSN